MSEQKLIETIELILKDNRKHILTMANEMHNALYSKYYASALYDSELLRKRGVCGVSQQAIAAILHLHELPVQEFFCEYKFAVNMYPNDHTFSIVDNVIIDGAYIQCIDHFNLQKEHMPSKDILIFPYNKLDEIVDGFMNIATHPLATQDERIKSLSLPMIKKHFREIWNYKNTNVYTTRNLKFIPYVNEYMTKHFSNWKIPENAIIETQSQKVSNY